MSVDRSTGLLRRDALAAYDAALAAVEPTAATRRAIPVIRPRLRSCRRVLVVAVGKAARPMADACSGLGAAGFVLSPATLTTDPSPSSDFEYLVGGHPVPTHEGFAASRRILEAATRLDEGDCLLFLLSGGASALFEVPVDGFADDDAIAVYEALVRSGLGIEEINTVRAALSQVKAGRLAAAARPAEVVTLAISDVVGDVPAAIGSGPTVAPRGTLGDARRLLDGVAMEDALRTRVMAVLRPPITQTVGGLYRIVASSADAATAARAMLAAAGYDPISPPLNPLCGDAERAAALIADAIRLRAPRPGRWSMVVAGETTVELPATTGDGGRNRHLACAVAAASQDVHDFVLLAAGTDGIDGSSSGAGGFVDGTTAARMRAAGVDLAASLSAFDSGGALAAVGDDIVTGPSATNVGDIVVAVGAGGS